MRWAFEVNEAFAAQAPATIRERGLPAERTNPNGSGGQGIAAVFARG